MATSQARTTDAVLHEVDSVVIRFAGDSGDGMQLTGTQFTNTSAIAGNDLATLPDFPAEIRAPAGTLAGVSGFQLNFSSQEVFTPGDDLDVLVAMNPAALRRNVPDVKRGGTLIVNTGGFTSKNLKIAGYDANPLEDDSLSGYRVIALDISALTGEALAESGLTAREVERCKNFYTLGLLFWMYSRPLEPTMDWIEKKFKGKDKLIEANETALKSGFHYGETTEIFQGRYEVRARRDVPPGLYNNPTGNRAVALGFVAAARRAKLPLFLGSYPITPASDILHELSRFKQYGVITFQAEDEIAAIGATIGASFAGCLAITTTSGPGLALKGEALGLAVIAELPMVLIDVQRGGPSTGLPTKTEQADLMQALYGRNGEAPVVVIAAQSPADCFDAAIEASRIATKFVVPVILLTDGYLANGSEPWKVPDEDELPDLTVKFATDPEGFLPYSRDEKTLARPWVRPGTPGMEHRIGGLEKAHLTGGVSYDPANHEKMVKLRAEKIDRVQQDIPDATVVGDKTGKVLVVGWGSTYGSIATAVERCRAEGKSVSMMHLRHLHPFPRNVEKMLESFETVLVPEINNGQLIRVLRGEYLARNLVPFSRIKGLPIKTSEIYEAITEITG